jgi:hypothetical protein
MFADVEVHGSIPHEGLSEKTGRFWDNVDCPTKGRDAVSKWTVSWRLAASRRPYRHPAPDERKWAGIVLQVGRNVGTRAVVLVQHHKQ